jgi:hypothetical protein
MSNVLKLAAAAIAAVLSVTTPAFSDTPVGYRISGPFVQRGITLFLVHGAPSDGRAVPLTLQETMPRQLVRVIETGTVNELAIENLSDHEVFIQAGEIVTGGKQDRVIISNLILPPHSGRIAMEAFCVEPGRWAARAGQDARAFAVTGSALPPSSARRVVASAARPVAQRSAPTASAATQAAQTQVWEDIRRAQRQLSRSLSADVHEPSAPTSFASTLQNGLLEQATEQFGDILSPPGLEDRDVVGYVFAFNGHPTSGEIFSSHELLRKLWPKLARAGIVDAIRAGSEQSGAAAPSQDEVMRFIEAPRGDGVQLQRVTDYVTQAVLDDDQRLLLETRRTDASWVARIYHAK